MKSNFTTFFLILVMIILIGGVGLIAYAICSDMLGEDVIDKISSYINEEPEEREKEINYNENTYISQLIEKETSDVESNEILNQAAVSKYFYIQLNDTEKRIYDKLNENKDNLKYGNCVINYGNEFSDILSQDNGDEILGDNYQTAIEAFIHDNPDLFYIDVNKMYLNIKTIKRLFLTTFDVYISPAENATFLSEDFMNTGEIEVGIAEIERVKDEVVSSLSGTDYQKIKMIHDYLVDNIEYDTDYNALGTYGIYGALVGKRCVCEGYAKAFKYLTNAAGYECEIMQGMATNSNGATENHAWNCIKIGDAWYEVDTTWDDPIVMGLGGKIISGVKSNSIRNKFFLKGSNVFDKDHTLSCQFSDNGKIFSYPTISTTDYKK